MAKSYLHDMVEHHKCLHYARYCSMQSKSDEIAFTELVADLEEKAQKRAIVPVLKPQEQIENVRAGIAKDNSNPNKIPSRTETLTILYSRLLQGPASLSHLADQIAKYRESKQFTTDWMNVPEKMALIVGELCGEAMEAYRHLTPTTLAHCMRVCKESPEQLGDPDQIGEDQCTIYVNFVEELADTLIRLLDLTASLGVDLEETLAFKMAANELRPIKHGKQR